MLISGIKRSVFYCSYFLLLCLSRNVFLIMVLIKKFDVLTLNIKLSSVLQAKHPIFSSGL